MRLPSFFVIFNFVAILSIAALVGCESADVDPEHIAASGGGTSDGTTPNPGGESVKTINVNPATGVHRSMGDYTVLEVNAIPGYTFTWALSDELLGRIPENTGDRVTYLTTIIPETGSQVQVITATGKNPNTSTIYRGTSRITHKAQ